MIVSNFKEHKGLDMNGSLSEISSECVLIMREIYKKNKEIYGEQMAVSLLMNLLIKAIFDDATKEQREILEEEMLAYTD